MEPSPVEGSGKVDVCKGGLNHYKSEFSLSILIYLFIVLELIILQNVFKKTN